MRLCGSLQEIFMLYHMCQSASHRQRRAKAVREIQEGYEANSLGAKERIGTPRVGI